MIKSALAQKNKLSEVVDLNWIEREKRSQWHPFTPMQRWEAAEFEPIFLESGSGIYLEDDQGRKYIDGSSSIWTNVHGHGNQRINEAIIAQLDKVAHTSFLGYTHHNAVILAEALMGYFSGSELKRVFYSDNGSTAVECSLRMSLQYWQFLGHRERKVFISFDKGYHGDTLGAASLNGIPLFNQHKGQDGYEVIVLKEIEDLEQLDESLQRRLAAVIIEPLIQGAAGMRLWPKGMLSQLREWTQKRGILLILDEVMTGFGRTGQMFACQHEGVIPDFLCLAKGLSGGYLPFAATLTTNSVYAAFLDRPEVGKTFYYGHSYTGNQLGCAAAIANLKYFQEADVMGHVKNILPVWEQALEKIQALPMVKEVRHIGLIAGIEVQGFDANQYAGAWICRKALDFGLLTRPILDTVVLMPPLCIQPDEIEIMMKALEKALWVASAELRNL